MRKHYQHPNRGSFARALLRPALIGLITLPIIILLFISVARVLALPTQEIAFMSNRGGYGYAWDIYLMDVWRGTIANITNRSRGWADVPVPEGVFYPGQALIEVPDPRTRYPAWSPDGRLIAFHSNRAGSYDLYLMDADGGNVRRLTSSDYYESQVYTQEAIAAWSADGQMVAFHADRASNWDIYAITLDDAVLNGAGTLNPLTDRNWTIVQRLTIAMTDELFPSWSPDSTQMVFASGSARRTNPSAALTVYIADVMRDGGLMRLVRARQLTDSSCNASEPRWSPDGRLIVYVCSQTGNMDLYIMRADGTGQRPLTSHSADDFNPRWLPDSSGIIFVSEREGSADLYYIRPDGGELRRLTSDPDEEWAGDWRP